MLPNKSTQPDSFWPQYKPGEVQALLNKDEQFHLWIENIADIITVFKADGTIFYQSASITRILGWAVEERVGQNIFTNPITHPDDVQAQQAFLIDAINNPNKIVTSTFRLQRKDGSSCYIEAIGRNLLHHPLVQGIVTTYRDITERMELEKRKEEFIRVASHELRIPITNLKGHTQVLKMMLEDHDAMEEPIEYLSIMDKQIDRLTRLINDLLDVTKISASMMDYKDTLFEVDAFIHNIVTLLQHISPRHTLRITGQSYATLCADKDRLAQVMINLIMNAIKYSPDAQYIDIEVASENGCVLIHVRDYGKGIPLPYQQKIFDRFYRVPDMDTESSSGLGIGLYVAREIIARHHGELWVESQPGEGSTFSISLPINTR
ncbi:PAS domain-containing sensor histidine kinase [Dictyobacter formicarum]|uniref:histidine kinase n=1 Tax=Dictyobacter formicarum TaxID=2778368 RepID=A0ABQ3VBH4_9CHLR|nr:PAS domain-containing sensor histidine kinase [Dictyobacter formicarum]GHO83158.1 hypothetical protein KSZ_11640 [Dictyobacter formicarum]